MADNCQVCLQVPRDASVALGPCGHQRFRVAYVAGRGTQPHVPALSLVNHCGAASILNCRFAPIFMSINGGIYTDWRTVGLLAN